MAKVTTDLRTLIWAAIDKPHVIVHADLCLGFPRIVQVLADPKTTTFRWTALITPSRACGKKACAVGSCKWLIKPTPDPMDCSNHTKLLA